MVHKKMVLINPKKNENPHLTFVAKKPHHDFPSFFALLANNAPSVVGFPEKIVKSYVYSITNTVPKESTGSCQI